MKTSCISLPASNNSLAIYTWQLLATSGNPCAAGTLSIFESILNCDVGMQDLQEQFFDKNDCAESLISENGIPLKIISIKNALMNLWGEKKIAKSLEQLEKLGFIKITKNLDPFVKTQSIQFYPEKCNLWIKDHYDELGNYIANPTGVIEDAEKSSREVQEAVSRTPKGASTKIKQVGLKNFNDLEPETFYVEKNLGIKKLQVLDSLENAKRLSRESQKAESRTPKGVLNINQLKAKRSININQPDENGFLGKEKESDNIKNSLEEKIEPILNALKSMGLAQDKLNYADVLPSISRLLDKGATIEIYIKAYEKAKRINQNGFGIKYLNKVVEGLLPKISNSAEMKNNKFKETITLDQTVRHFETNIDNAMQWASPYMYGLNKEGPAMMTSQLKQTLDSFQPLTIDDLERFRSEAVRVESEARAAERIKTYLNKVPKRYHGKTLESFLTHSTEQATVKQIVSRFIETFAARVLEGTSLIFLGNPGTGKTLLSLIIYQDLAKQRYNVKYESSLQFLKVIQEKKYESNAAYQAILKSYTEADFLILDEVTESVTKDGSPSEFDKKLLFDVINARYEMGNKSTLVISNRDKKGLINRVGLPVFDRLLEKGVLLGFNWESFRT